MINYLTDHTLFSSFNFNTWTQKDWFHIIIRQRKSISFHFAGAKTHQLLKQYIRYNSQPISKIAVDSVS